MKKIFLILPLSVLCLALLSILAGTGQAQDREEEIFSKLECVSRHYDQNLNMDWTDICYKEEPKPRGAGREELVDSELRETERSNDNKSFVTTNEQRTEEVARSVTDREDIILDDDVVVAQDEPFLETKFDMSAGYRHDELQWSIAGTSAGTSPNILSELTWTDLQSYVIKGNGQLIFGQHYVLDGMAMYGEIFAGDNQDSDYLGNNRTLEFSRSNNTANSGDVRDFSAGVGYRVSLHEDFARASFLVEEASATMLVGYSHHEQNLTITEGFQTIPATGAFAGLHSTYETEWNGPWLGAEIEGQTGRFSAGFRYEYHFVDYYADADWNLRTDFQHPKSYEHEADGDGYVISVRGGYQLTDQWQLNLKADWFDFQTDHGIDRTFFSDGTQSETRLNVVDWQAYTVMLGLRFQFP